METLISFSLAITSGVLVSLITLWLSGLQRANQEERSEKRRRDAIFAAIGEELRWNRSAIRTDVDVTNAHILVGALTSVAFERYGADLSTIAPDCIKPVFKHYAQVGKTREGIRAIAGSRDFEASDKVRQQWIKICDDARVEIAKSATQALECLHLPLSNM